MYFPICSCCGEQTEGFAAVIDGRAYCADCFVPPIFVPAANGIGKEPVIQHPMFPPEKANQENPDGTTNT